MCPITLRRDLCMLRDEESSIDVGRPELNVIPTKFDHF